MRSLTRVTCLKCNAVYETPLQKFRLTFFGWRTYERCNSCGRWAWHKGPFSQIRKSKAKE